MTPADREPEGGTPNRLVAWLTSLGPLTADRPPPSLGHATAGVGGALVAAGVVVVGSHRWATTGDAAQGIVLTLLLLAGSVLAITRAPAPLAVAGVAAAGVAAPAVGFFLAATGDRLPSLREVAVLAGLLLAALYGLGPWRGHTFHLTLLVVAGWALALTAADIGFTRSGGLSTVGDTITSAGAASMAVGVVYLGLGSWLHDEGLRGVATPFLGMAALALPAGGLALLRDRDEVLQGVVLLAAGAAVALVGGRCRRRGLTWVGLGIGAAGVGLVPAGLTDSTVAGAVLVALAGAGLVVAAPRAAAVVGEHAAALLAEPEPLLPDPSDWTPPDEPPTTVEPGPALGPTVRRRRPPPAAGPPEKPSG